MIQIKKAGKQIHWPTLNTVIMVEDAMKNMEKGVFSIAELKKKLAKTGKSSYFDGYFGIFGKSNKIAVTLKGLTWIENNNPTLKKAILKGMEL